MQQLVAADGWYGVYACILRALRPMTNTNDDDHDATHAPLYIGRIPPSYSPPSASASLSKCV